MPTNQERLETYQIIRNIRHRYKLDQMESGHLGRILPMVDQAKQEIRNALENRFDVDTWTDERNGALLQELRQLSDEVKQDLRGEVGGAAQSAFEQSAQEHSDIYSLAGRAANVSTLQLSQEQIRNFVDTPVGGRTLSEWVNRSFDEPLQRKLQEELGAGLFRGESYRKLSNRIDELMDEARTNVETLTRSYIQDSSVRAQKEMLDQNRDIMQGWRWNAILENSSFTKGHGTCLRCLSLDSQDTIYPLDGGPMIPLHANCRCNRDMIPQSWEQLGVSREGLDEAVNELRQDRPFSMRGKVDPITGEFIERGKTGTGGVPLIEAGQLRGGYSEFFERMPEQMRRTSLGPTRYRMWQEGEIELSDLADANGRQRTIAELKKLRSSGTVGPSVTDEYGFAPAGNFDEAQKWAVQNLIRHEGAISPSKKVNLEGYELGLVNEINRHLNKRLTQLKGNPGLEDGRLGEIAVDARTKAHAHISPTFADLGLNYDLNNKEKWGEIWDKSTQHQEMNPKNRPWSIKSYFSREQSVNKTLDHELGHVIFEQTLSKQDKSTLSRMITRASKGGKWQLPSTYATDSHHERFAEIFALFVDNRTDILKPEIVEFLRKKIKMGD